MFFNYIPKGLKHSLFGNKQTKIDKQINKLRTISYLRNFFWFSKEKLFRTSQNLSMTSWPCSSQHINNKILSISIALECNEQLKLQQKKGKVIYSFLFSVNDPKFKVIVKYYEFVRLQNSAKEAKNIKERERERESNRFIATTICSMVTQIINIHALQ